MSEIVFCPASYPPTEVQGLRIRTCNQDEMTPGNGKIPGLWQSFYRDVFPQVAQGASAYGVYSNYESDHTGYYDLSAAVASSNLNNPPSACLASEIGGGAYLKFSPTTPGEDPVKQIMGMWQEVWNHFTHGDCAHQRAFSADFELYHPDQKVELYIAVR